MATAVYAGQGTVLKATISSSLTAIAQVVELDGPACTTGVKETINLGSTSITKRAQLPDGGTISGTLQYDPTDTTQVFLTGLITTWPQSVSAWEMIWPAAISGTHMVSFSGILTKFQPKGMNQEDNLEADFEITISGVPTFS
jgi:hypothetical protein